MMTYEESRRAELTRDLKERLRGSEYKFTKTAIGRHLNCNVEISESRCVFTCHTHIVAGLYV